MSEVFVLVNLRKRDRRRKPFNGDTVPCGLGVRKKNLVTPIMFKGRPDVVTISSVWSKGESLIWCVVDDDSSSGDRKGCTIESIVPKKARMSRQVGLTS